MAGRTQREIRDQDVQGLKYLRKLRPLLSRLRKVGTGPDHQVRLICVAVKPHESYVSSPIGSICRHLFSDKHHGVEIQA